MLEYNFLKEYYKSIATDLSKQEALDAVSRVIQQISFTGNLDRAKDETIFFIIKEAKETKLDFLKGTLRVLSMLCESCNLRSL